MDSPQTGSSRELPWTVVSFPLGRHRIWIDLGNLAVILGMVAVVAWYFVAAHSASASLQNLLMIAPVSLLLAVLFVLVAIQCVHTAPPDPERDASLNRLPVGARIPALMALVALYMAVVPALGFDVGSTLFMIACLLVLGERNLVRIVIFSILFGALVGWALSAGLAFDPPLLLLG